jgi:hypothetical protein
MKDLVKNNIAQELRGYSSKEVVIPGEGVLGEVVVPKKGVLGKVKLGIKYLDEKMHKIDTVYLTFKDKSKRKFI